MYEIWVLSLAALHCVLLYVGASILNVCLTTTTWLWFCYMWLTNSSLQDRRMTIHVIGKVIYMACHASLGIHLLSVGMQTQPSVFVRKEGLLSCNLDSIQSLDVSIATNDICGPGGYSTEPMRRFYPLVQDPDFLLETVSPHWTNSRKLRPCKDTGYICFKWAVRMKETQTERTPPAEMVERILVHDAEKVYLIRPEYKEMEANIYMLEMKVANTEDLEFVQIPSVIPTMLDIVQTNVVGVQEINSLDVDIQKGDIFIVHRSTIPLRVPNMHLAMSRYCPPQVDVCSHQQYGSTRHYFDIAIVTQPLSFSLFSTISKCGNMIYEVCDVSPTAHIFLLLLNLFLAASSLLLLHINNQQYQDSNVLISFWMVLCVLIANYIVLIYIVVMPTFKRSTMAYSGLMFVLLVLQFSYNIAELWRLDFGLNEKYITLRHGSINWFALFVNPANYYGGALFVQCLYFSIVLGWCALLRSIAMLFAGRKMHQKGKNTSIFPELKLESQLLRGKAKYSDSVFNHAQ